MGVIIVDLSRNIIKRYVQVASPEKITSNSETVYGTVVNEGETLYVKIDGSDILTPVSSTIDIKANDRVLVLVKNHEATVIGSPSSPTARLEELNKLGTEVTEFKAVATGDLIAARADIDKLKANNVDITGRLTANEGYIDNLTTENTNIKGQLNAYKADIENLSADHADFKKATAKDFKAVNASIENLNAKNATIEGTLNAHNASIDNLNTKNATIEGTLNAHNASIDNLTTTVFDAETGKVKFADIDFANIGDAAVENFYAASGIIQNLTLETGVVVKELVGVKIKGDLIEANSIQADKLVVKGSDGFYYKLNVDALGETTASADPKYQNGLDGSVIIAKSIAAEKVSVSDLVAFGATIGGFHITATDIETNKPGAIYSGTKESAENTTRGIYLDSDGQIAFGDSSNFIKYYKNQNGNYKLEISAKSILIGSSGKNVETIAENAENAVGKVNSLEERANSGEFNGEDAVTLRIESSRGTVFKNDSVSTVLSVVIYRGGDRITNSADLASAFGSGAYLQWKWQRLDDETFGVISSGDTRFGDNGFKFTLSPEDVDTKITFMCELIV